MRREDFPIFKGRNLIYLDSASSTQKPEAVIDSICSFCSTSYSNVHRGVYPLSEAATSCYESARQAVSDFIGAEREEVIFVSSTTEAINLVAYSWGRKNLSPDETVLGTIMEHHSNFVPWQQIAMEKNARFRVVRIDGEGKLDLDHLEEELKKGVRLFACTMVSNVLGTVNPIKEITELAHRYGAITVVDGAQAIAHMPVDVKDLDVDFFAFSGHKMYGPTGIGVLYGRKDILESLPPFLYGGEMISEVHIDHTRFSEIPFKFEAGTPPITEAIGLARAIEYLIETGFESISAHESNLTHHAFRMLRAMPGVILYGPQPAERIGVISFNIDGAHPHDIAGLLGSNDICIRAGHHCAQPLHEFLGIPASARISFGLYNRIEDLELFKERLENVGHILMRTS
ncbi:MAG: aminotransferase class V-fold PLP-dependent enzyme [Candidatus Glassbacteria bacterium]